MILVYSSTSLWIPLYSVAFRLYIWKVSQCVNACMCPSMFSTDAQATKKRETMQMDRSVCQWWWMLHVPFNIEHVNGMLYGAATKPSGGVWNITNAETICRRMPFIDEPQSMSIFSFFWDPVLYEITFIVIAPGLIFDVSSRLMNQF